VARGPVLVVVPSVDRARLEAARLRRAGLAVAVAPTEWAAGAGGVDVVIGARAAAWAPCAGMAAVIVVDEHDESLQEERSPTWHARDVVLERARRAGVPALLVSPCPSVAGLAAVAGHVSRPAIDDERAGWPIVEVVDRSRDEPWKTSLVTSALITQLRDPTRTVVCVHNTPGRARILACRSCRTLARCAVCEAAVGLADDGTLACRRCGTVRPQVCLHCGASAFANLRPGVTRLREELEAAAGRPVVAVTGRDDEPPVAAGVYVGTEAVLHRVRRADVVAFLDIDAELLAPRYRAAEQAMALLVRGARLAGRRGDGGRLLVQTFLPRHEVVRAALLADPGRLVEPERARRRLLGLPPFAALAAISGAGSDEVAAALREVPGVDVGGSDRAYTARAATWDDLGRAIIATPRPRGSRVRVAVDPPRQ
jgi:primosomal protein N' (replication factor Y)